MKEKFVELQPVIDPLLSVRQVAAHLSVSVSTVWSWIAQKKFPAGLRLTNRCTRWKLSTVQNSIPSIPKQAE